MANTKKCLLVFFFFVVVYTQIFSSPGGKLVLVKNDKGLHYSEEDPGNTYTYECGIASDGIIESISYSGSSREGVKLKKSIPIIRNKNTLTWINRGLSESDPDSFNEWKLTRNSKGFIFESKRHFLEKGKVVERKTRQKVLIINQDGVLWESEEVRAMLKVDSYDEIGLKPEEYYLRKKLHEPEKYFFVDGVLSRYYSLDWGKRFVESQDRMTISKDSISIIGYMNWGDIDLEKEVIVDSWYHNGRTVKMSARDFSSSDMTINVINDFILRSMLIPVWIPYLYNIGLPKAQ